MALKTFTTKKAEVEVDGLKLSVSQLTISQVQRLRELQENAANIALPAYLEQTTQIIFECLQNNMPGMTFKVLADHLNMESWKYLLSELMVVSGMVTAGEEAPKA